MFEKFFSIEYHLDHSEWFISAATMFFLCLI